MMDRNTFQWLVIGLLVANIAAAYVIGSVLFNELQRPARVVRIYQGGRDDKQPGPGESGDEA